MGQDPAAIREEIEHTRERMGDTVDALGYKADVPARTKDRVSEGVHSLKAKVSGAGDTLSSATPDADDIRHGARQAVGLAQENPLGLTIGAAAVGFLAGMLMPHTRVEDERLGPASDQAKRQLAETTQEAVEHGKQLVQETAQVAEGRAQEVFEEVRGQVQDSAQAHASELVDSARENAAQVADTARQS